MTKLNSFRLIKGERIIDAKGGDVLERGAILLQGDKIISIGREEDVIPPEGSQVEEIVYENKTVLPGLVDCHVHLNGIGDGRKGDQLNLLPDEILTLQAAKNARTHLFSGVTTVRDCGAKNSTTLRLREAVQMGITVAPKLVLAGRPMAIIGGHLWWFGIQATGPNECRAHVRQLVKEGVDFIKITASGGSTGTSVPLRPSFNLEEMNAIVDEAHKFGKHTAAHCTNSQSMINALDAGIDTIIHGVYNEPDGDRSYRPDITERIVDQGVFLNPTIHQSRERIWQLEEKSQNQKLNPEEVEELNTTKEGHEQRIEEVSKMWEAGVKIVCGSDSAWANYKMGRFQADINSHISIGMSPMEAILSATNLSAQSCCIDDQVGTLEVGKNADILVVEGDPSKNIDDLWNIVDIYLDGNLIDRGNYI